MELGIGDADACIRAANLDRPELTLRCTQVLVPDKREHMAETSVRHFIRDHHLDTDGVLIFCPFRGGRAIGVFSVAAHLSRTLRSEEHTSELQSLMRISYAVFCLTKINNDSSLQPKSQTR